VAEPWAEALPLPLDVIPSDASCALVSGTNTLTKIENALIAAGLRRPSR